MINEGESSQPEAINARPRIEVYNSVERRCRWSGEEEQLLLREAAQTGSSMSSVDRNCGVSASQMFAWRKQFQKGGQIAVRAND